MSPSPIERYGAIWAKRDDLYRSPGGAIGGKARSCWALARGAPGLITASSRSSPQAAIVALTARRLGIPARIHTPQGEPGAELQLAESAGAERIPHRAGYQSVIAARAREDAGRSGWRLIPFGMVCQEAIDQTAAQLGEIPPGVRRIVVPVGSGMSLAGVLAGLERLGSSVPVLGVVVGSDPQRRLDRWSPLWRYRAELRRAPEPYDRAVAAALPGGAELDPIYEAKCLQFLLPGDLLWIVGIRSSLLALEE